MGLRIAMTKSVKTVRMTRLRRRVQLRARSLGGASEVSQIVISQRFLDSQVQNAFSQAFAKMLSQKYLGLASFCNSWSMTIWRLGTHDIRYDFMIFFIYMNSYMNS